MKNRPSVATDAHWPRRAHQYGGPRNHLPECAGHPRHTASPNVLPAVQRLRGDASAAASTNGTAANGAATRPQQQCRGSGHPRRRFPEHGPPGQCRIGEAQHFPPAANDCHVANAGRACLSHHAATGSPDVRAKLLAATSLPRAPARLGAVRGSLNGLRQGQ